MILEYLKIAGLMMRARPVRSILSWLGIYIGILALVVILTIHEGIRREMTDLFHTQGARVVLVRPRLSQEMRMEGRVTLTDVQRLRDARGVMSVLPQLQNALEVRSEQASKHAKILGVDEHFLSIYRIPLLKGRLFLPQEIATQQAVCLITPEAVQELFPYSEPMHATITMKGTAYEIIGVMDWQPAMSKRTGMEEPDFFVPYPWLLGKNQDIFARVEVRVQPEFTSDQAIDMVRDVLSHGDKARATLYDVMTLEKYFEKSQASMDKALYGLLVIAGISLLVGGIGIANVMLTSVTERTREIGIRKALGATRKNILAQFLVESCALCGSGGLAAIVTGWGLVAIISTIFPNNISLAVPERPIMMCMAVTLLVGVIAGLYPASRAASLSPAEALRYE